MFDRRHTLKRQAVGRKARGESRAVRGEARDVSRMADGGAR